jgi:di/tricarboxylate transporter
VSPATLSLLVLVGVVGLFVWNRLPVEVVAIGSALTLYALGVIDLPEALAGFADPTVLLIAALFVIGEGLDATGVTTWVGDRVFSGDRVDPRRSVVLVMLLSAGVTALINPNGSVAALLPLVLIVAVQRRQAPARLLLPLAFAAHAGSLLLLTGSPVNIVIAEAAEDAGVGRIGFAEFALVGVPLVVGTIAIVLALGDRTIPERATATGARDLRQHARTLLQQYELAHVVHAVVGPESPLLGRPRAGLDLGNRTDLRIVTQVDAADGRPTADGVIGAGDRITLVGEPDQAASFCAEHGFEVATTRGLDEIASAVLHRDGGVAEIVVPPRSRYLGVRVRTGDVVNDGRLVVLAVQRRGREVGAGGTALTPGDVLLVEGAWETLDGLEASPDVLLVDAPALLRRRTVPLGARSRRAITILVVLVVLLATGLVPPVVAALLGAGAMVVSGVLGIEQAYRRISWPTVLLVAGMIPLSTAIRDSGAGELLAGGIIEVVGDLGPHALLLALFVLTAGLGQLISNMATVLIVIPVALSATDQLGISARPVLLSVCVAAAAAFLTPVATPANLMIMGPAGLRFGDYWRLGLPLVGLFLVVAVGLVPVIWPF